MAVTLTPAMSSNRVDKADKCVSDGWVARVVIALMAFKSVAESTKVTLGASTDPDLAAADVMR